MIALEARVIAAVRSWYGLGDGEWYRLSECNLRTDITIYNLSFTIIMSIIYRVNAFVLHTYW
jgi:hypothetical protein